MRRAALPRRILSRRMADARKAAAQPEGQQENRPAGQGDRIAANARMRVGDQHAEKQIKRSEDEKHRSGRPLPNEMFP